MDLDEARAVVAEQHHAVLTNPDWDDYRAAMERDQRVLLQVELTSAGPDREG